MNSTSASSKLARCHNAVIKPPRIICRPSFSTSVINCPENCEWRSSWSFKFDMLALSRRNMSRTSVSLAPSSSRTTTLYAQNASLFVGSSDSQNDPSHLAVTSSPARVRSF